MTRRRGTMCSVLPRAGRRGLLNGRRDGHSGRLEHLATTPLDLAPEQEPLPVLLHLDHLQPVQITDHIGPLQVVAPLLQSDCNSWRSTNARNEQNTCPRIVSSRLW